MKCHGCSSFYGEWHQPETCSFSGFGCGLFLGKEAEIDVFPVDLDRRYPLSTRIAPRNATVWRRRAPRAGLILGISVPRDGSQVLSSVVKAVPVDMVTLLCTTGHKPEKLSMQGEGGDLFAPIITSSGLGSVGVPRVMEMPPPLPGPLSIRRVDQGVRANRTVTGAQRNTGRQSVLTEDDGKPISSTAAIISTGGGAVARSAYIDLPSPGKEVLAALLADTWNGTLVGHRATPSLVVTPAAVCAARRRSCVRIIPDSLRVGNYHAV